MGKEFTAGEWRWRTYVVRGEGGGGVNDEQQFCIFTPSQFHQSRIAGREDIGGKEREEQE